MGKEKKEKRKKKKKKNQTINFFLVKWSVNFSNMIRDEGKWVTRIFDYKQKDFLYCV